MFLAKTKLCLDDKMVKWIYSDRASFAFILIKNSPLNLFRSYVKRVSSCAMFEKKVWKLVWSKISSAYEWEKVINDTNQYWASLVCVSPKRPSKKKEASSTNQINHILSWKGNFSALSNARNRKRFVSDAQAQLKCVRQQISTEPLAPYMAEKLKSYSNFQNWQHEISFFRVFIGLIMGIVQEKGHNQTFSKLGSEKYWNDFDKL